MSDRCPIGPLQLHTWNYERTECIRPRTEAIVAARRHVASAHG